MTEGHSDYNGDGSRPRLVPISVTIYRASMCVGLIALGLTMTTFGYATLSIASTAYDAAPLMGKFSAFIFLVGGLAITIAGALYPVRDSHR